MNIPWASVLDFLIKGLALLGGIGVVAGAVSAFVFKFFADRIIEKHRSALTQEVERLKAELNLDLETHKGKLRRLELLYAKQVDAASAFFALHQKIKPAYSHPDKELDEALEEVIDDLSSTEEQLQDFLTKFGPVLSPVVRKELDECISLAMGNKFAEVRGGKTSAVFDSAQELLDKLDKIEAAVTEELKQ